MPRIDQQCGLHASATRRVTHAGQRRDAIQPVTAADERRRVEIIPRISAFNQMPQGAIERIEIVVAVGQWYSGAPGEQAEMHALRKPREQEAEYRQCDEELEQCEAIRRTD